MSFRQDDFFLSATNPIATADQRDLEALALRVIATPEVQRARAMATQRWKVCVGRDAPEEAWLRFDGLMDEWVFHYALKAVNADANYPKVLGHLWGPPHEWFGMQVPGSRASAGDNPDSNMSIVPIDAWSRFELHGQRLPNPVADVPFTLSGNLSQSMTLATLDGNALVTDGDGRFVITLDPAPANGRPNHIQTQPDSRWLFIRDCRGDWSQSPNAYRIHRLDAPLAPPLGFEQLVARAARYIVDDVPALHWVMRAADALPVNTFSPPVSAASVGGMATQMLSMANLALDEDEALVLNVGSGGARYRTIVVHDYWLRTFDYWNTTSTANTTQALPDADGSTTYVISMRDPGVHNWLDTVGTRATKLLHRWQGVPADLAPADAPTIRATRVRFADLANVLPADTRRVTPAERAAQIAARRRGFGLRYAV